MHRYPPSIHEQARARASRRRALVLVALAAAAIGSDLMPGATARSHAAGLAFTAADAPRTDRGREQKAAPRPKKPRTTRDTGFGREGDLRKANRVIPIEMSDTMRYFPQHVTVRKGQTVRFNVRNAGELPHEMVIGTMDDLKKNVALVRKNADVELDEPNAAHVEPGGTGRIVWQFTRAGEFYYGCLVPGHFEAGMIGTIVVR